MARSGLGLYVGIRLIICGDVGNGPASTPTNLSVCSAGSSRGGSGFRGPPRYSLGLQPGIRVECTRESLEMALEGKRRCILLRRT